jgi:hypothetical protein
MPVLARENRHLHRIFLSLKLFILILHSFFYLFLGNLSVWKTVENVWMFNFFIDSVKLSRV